MFFLSTLAAPLRTLDRYLGESLTHPMLITAFYHIRPEGHQELRKEVQSLNPVKRLVELESGNLRFTHNASTY